MLRCAEQSAGVAAVAAVKSVEDWRCPSSRPLYSTTHDVVTSDKRRVSDPDDDHRDQRRLVETGGQLAASLPAPSAVERLTDASDDGDRSLPYVVLATIIVSVILLLVIVGALSYFAAVHS